MRILIISFPVSSEAIGGEEQIAEALKESFEGHEVAVYTRENQDLLKAQDYDLVLSLSLPVEILAKKSTVWLSWVFNDNLGKTPEDILANNFDGFLTNSRKISGDNTQFLPFPSFDYYVRKTPLSKEQKYDILYMGNFNPEYKTVSRINDFLLPCLKHNFAIFGGSKWLFQEQKRLFQEGRFQAENFSKVYEPYYQGIFPVSECSRISDYSKVFLNFNAPGQTLLGMINNRVFDFLANGCFVITDDTPEQRDTFGNVVEYSTGGSDLAEKLNFYLANPEKRLEKQKLALEFSQTSYKDAVSKILSLYQKVKDSPVKPGKIEVLVIVDNIHILNFFLKQFPKDFQNFTFFTPKGTRIKTEQIVEEHGLSKNLVQIVAADDIYAYKPDVSSFDKTSVLVPTYSSMQQYPANFLSLLEQAVLTNENVDVFKFSTDSYLPYGQFAVRKRASGKYLDWNLLKTKKAKLLNLNLRQHFDTQKERESFQKEVLKYTVLKEVEKKPIETLRSSKIENLRYSVFTNKPVAYENTEVIEQVSSIEAKIRELRSHYTILNFQENIDWSRLSPIVASHFNYDLFIFGSTLIFRTNLLSSLKPAKTLKELFETILAQKEFLPTLYINPLTYDLKVVSPFTFKPRAKGLKVAVMSMCGVSSYEDKYGIGGEHQVVHWLKDAFEKRDDVHYCHIFDTFNYDLLDPDDYDIIFSNSCWRSVSPKRKRKDNLTIFWHFNDDSGHATMETVERMGYDYVWTNSYIGYDWLQKKSLKCDFKQLNASSKYHQPYPYESSLYREADCVYVGGYQVHYKGKEMIDNFVKPCLGQDFKFSIYGNRLWKSEVQKQALETDSYFKPEFYDESFDPYYRGILPSQDFNILAKNVPIWINFNAITQRAYQMNNDRVIWGLACGAFFITDDTPEARRFYGTDGPVVFTSGGKDLVDKVKYYLSRPEERLEIASRGSEFVRKNKLYTEDTVEKVVELWKSTTLSK
jgi:spore maturation protein CgeB